MKLSRQAIHRPVFTVMVMLIVIIMGGVSLVRLPVDLMPDITFPSLSISTEYEGASPEEIEELVTRPIEQGVAAVPGVEEISSVSTEGRSRIRISFTWGTDLSEAAADLRDRLDRVIPRLPDDASRPRLWKFDLASFPILICGASSDRDLVELRRIIDDDVKYRIERIAGVAALDVWGGLEREIHVNLKPDEMEAHHIPLSQIIARIKAGNVNVAAGELETGNLEVTVRTPGEYVDLNELRNTVIAMPDGVPVLLSKLADVKDTWQRERQRVRVNGKQGVRLSINKQSGTNTVEVAQACLAEIEKINRDIPQIEITPIIDSSEYIERSITNIGSMAVYGGGLAVIVLLVFLRSIRSTAIIATAIPLSIVATFALLYFGGLTLNIMTLGGLALGIGMLIDNSIVVLENIYRLRESGASGIDAAVHGSEEVTSAIIASTLTTIVVFLPVVFIRGVPGVMFSQMAYVVGFALFCSLMVALTLVPMLAARLLPAPVAEGTHQTLGHKVFLATGALFKSLENGYRGFIHFALSQRLLVTGVAAAALVGSFLLVQFIGAEFMPQSDEGEVRVNVEAEVGTRLGVIDARIHEIEDIVTESVPELKSMVARAGGGGFRSSGGHTGQLRVALVPQSERKRSSEEIAQMLRQKTRRIPGVKVRTRAGQGFFLIQRTMSQGGEAVEIELRGYELEVADALAEKVKTIVESIDGVTDARVSRESGAPEELIHVDRLKAADMGLTVREIAEMLQTVLSGKEAGNFRTHGKEYPIVVKLKDSERLPLARVLELTLNNADGDAVVLRNVIDTQPRLGPVRVERKDQERVITVSANIADRDMGSIMEDIRERLQSVAVPQGFAITFGGDYEEQQKANKELQLGFVLALVLVYMVMACQYESLRDPFVVMFTVPFAAIGVFVMLFLTDTTFNVQSYIGCIMLGGIVVNNAILLVDHTNLLRRRDGMPLRQAIEEAGRRRLRPILMTAMTTMLGLLPLALGLGEGGEAQAPLARAVIGGLASSTVITLVFVPVVYSLFERKVGKKHVAPVD